MGRAIAERFRSEISPSRRLPRSGLNAGCAPQFNKQEKLRGLEKGLRYCFGLSCALYNRYNCEKMVLIVLTQRHGGTKAQSDL